MNPENFKLSFSIDLNESDTATYFKDETTEEDLVNHKIILERKLDNGL